MVDFSPFRGWRPPENLASEVACRPYDVLSRNEAFETINLNPNSMMKVIRPDAAMLLDDIQFQVGDEYSVATTAFKQLLDAGLLEQDDSPSFYVYAQEMDGHRQIGVMGLASTEDYNADRIKKHEFTPKIKYYTLYFCH